MDRALDPKSLASALPAARVTVRSLGADGRALQAQVIRVPDRVLTELRDGLARSGQGFRALTRDVRYVGEAEIDGVGTDHVAGALDAVALLKAADRAGANGRIGPTPGRDAPGDGLSRASFDLYAARPDGVLERLDLTLTFKSSDNALPPTRIRFSVTGESPMPPE